MRCWWILGAGVLSACASAGEGTGGPPEAAAVAHAAEGAKEAASVVWERASTQDGESGCAVYGEAPLRVERVREDASRVYVDLEHHASVSGGALGTAELSVDVRPLRSAAAARLTSLSVEAAATAGRRTLSFPKGALPAGQFELTVRLGAAAYTLALALTSAGSVASLVDREREDFVWGEDAVTYVGPSSATVEVK